MEMQICKFKLSIITILYNDYHHHYNNIHNLYSANLLLHARIPIQLNIHRIEIYGGRRA